MVRITKDARFVLDSGWLFQANELLYSGTRLDFLRVRRKKAAKEFISFMSANRLPDLKIKIFMNAPAIPGVQLFQFVNLCHRYKFIIGYNPYDPVLAKRFIAKGTLVSGKLSGTAGKTTLGLNYKNEVGQTEFLFDKYKRQQEILFGRNVMEDEQSVFAGYKTSNFFEHDLFFYTQHPLFINALKLFTPPLK
jgi:hypothetical protein